MRDPTFDPKPTSDQQFLVIGLGSLGQHCVMALKEFGVRVVAIEISPPPTWEFSQLPQILDHFILGDSCQDQILQEAGIAQTRAALIVTNYERVNAETALAIRQLNPDTRLVVRSGKENLNQLLSETLGNFIAFEATELPAVAFAIAALGTDTLGFFNLEGQWLRVIKQQTAAHHPWCDRHIDEINSRLRRVLLHSKEAHPLTPPFYQWQPEHLIHENDQIVYVETADQFLLQQRQKAASLADHLKRRRWSAFFAQQRQTLTIQRIKTALWQSIGQFWQLSLGQQIRRVALLCGGIIGILLVMGTILFHHYYPDTTLLTAFYGTVVLLLGGYGDLFGGFELIPDVPGWLQLFALSLTIIGTGFVGVLYALLTETLLSSKFQLIRQRPPIPHQNHVIVMGLGRIGQQVAQFLEAFQEPLVGIRLGADDDPTILSHLPLITTPFAKPDLRIALTQANVTTAKSVVVATDDEMLNLEAALMVRSLNDKSHLAIRIYGQQLSQHLAKILPDAQVFCTYAVMAEAFAGAAFGEKILSLFRLHNQTVLVTEYAIELGDTLVHRLLAEVAYGYGVVPLLHQKKGGETYFLPSDDLRLQPGDRLIVLATMESLRWVELGQLAPPEWHVDLTRLRNSEAAFEGANVITRMTGYPLAEARSLMHHLPTVLPCPLYHHQAQRLLRALKHCQVQAQLRRV
ncbi:NAD-binding protein [Spirulina sp. CCNP1310]|uniref:potassium channel family protein n=1 Tax=Spirulina sp. CCNP1310 TaxID=3110249 RepID=UPI002B1F4739|nr:NAD-binding protein [Spirulina sp. CCNP1310]MEA5420121.1 NAD-binding protein [Spirulina sp. CCNP1310]